MAGDTLNHDVHVNGHLSAKTFAAPTGSIIDAQISPSAAIAASKVKHQFSLPYAQVPGTAIVAVTQDIHIVQGTTGAIVAVEAAVTGAIATGADRTVNVDLQKSTAAGAFATVLTGTVLLDDGSVLRTLVAATIASTALVAGDILRVIIAVAGAAGNQGQGLIVTVTLWEDPT